MSDLFGNDIVGFPTRRLIYVIHKEHKVKTLLFMCQTFYVTLEIIERKTTEDHSTRNAFQKQISRKLFTIKKCKLGLVSY